MSKAMLVLGFGRGEAGVAALVSGWSEPEDGFCWSLGTRSELSVRVPPADGEVFLELALNPFTEPGSPRRLTVGVNGRRIGEERIGGEGILGYRIAPELLVDDGRLTLTIETDAVRSLEALGIAPDPRPLGFMLKELRVVRTDPAPRADATALPPLRLPDGGPALVQAMRGLTGVSPRDLTLQFESLGHNCEFGILQRHLGAEPISLLRFAGITMDHLVDGLRRGFRGVGDEVAVRPHPSSAAHSEYIVHDDRYHIGLHSFRSTAEASAEEVRAEHQLRLQFAARQFFRCLKTGEKLFVFQRTGQITRAHAQVVLNLLRGFGPNALLYVDTEPRLPSGAVEQVGYGLFHGRLDRMAPADDIGDLDILGWLSICANAWRLWRKMQPAPAMP